MSEYALSELSIGKAEEEGEDKEHEQHEKGEWHQQKLSEILPTKQTDRPDQTRTHHTKAN